jgi:hypothetical protein
MKILSICTMTLFLMTKIVQAAPILYDCNSPRPEVAGFHNMVLFGTPEDKLYTYHLPLFAGKTNGSTGHVLMHVYQGLWTVQLDAATKNAYDAKFTKEKTAENPLPFFSIGPEGKRFKVPEMICNPKFSLSARTVYGHIEGNADFPAPKELIQPLSTVNAIETVFARRFDGSSKSALTYLIFGTPKQHYMVHFLTDDESSFDQIVAVEIVDAELKSAVEREGTLLVSVPVVPENGLVALSEITIKKSPNNIWKLPTSPLGKTIKVSEVTSSLSGRIKIIGEIYFNSNNDLKK